FAYAAMDMILETIEKTGPDRTKVIDELGNLTAGDSTFGKITLDDHGQKTVPVITRYVIQDGKCVEWDESEYASGKRKLPGQKQQSDSRRGSCEARLAVFRAPTGKSTSWMWGCLLNTS